MNRTDQIFEILSNWIKFLVTCIDAIPEEAGPRKVEVMTPEDDYIDEVDEMISHKVTLLNLLMQHVLGLFFPNWGFSY